MNTDKSPLQSALQAIVAQVEQAMQAELQEHLAAADPLLKEVLHYSLFSGGKRIRPVLCVIPGIEQVSGAHAPADVSPLAAGPGRQP